MFFFLLLHDFQQLRKHTCISSKSPWLREPRPGSAGPLPRGLTRLRSRCLLGCTPFWSLGSPPKLRQFSAECRPWHPWTESPASCGCQLGPLSAPQPPRVSSARPLVTTWRLTSSQSAGESLVSRRLDSVFPLAIQQDIIRGDVPLSRIFYESVPIVGRGSYGTVALRLWLTQRGHLCCWSALRKPSTSSRSLPPSTVDPPSHPGDLCSVLKKVPVSLKSWYLHILGALKREAQRDSFW